MIFLQGFPASGGREYRRVPKVSVLPEGTTTATLLCAPLPSGRRNTKLAPLKGSRAPKILIKGAARALGQKLRRILTLPEIIRFWGI